MEEATRTLTNYYLLEADNPELPDRYECVASTGDYPPFEAMRNKARDKRFFCNLNKYGFAGRARLSLTNSNNISSIFTKSDQKDLRSLTGFGDMRGTNDALVFHFSKNGKGLEIFVAQGQKSKVKAIFSEFEGRLLSDDIAVLRGRARGMRGDGESQRRATIQPPTPAPTESDLFIGLEAAEHTPVTDGNRITAARTSA